MLSYAPNGTVRPRRYLMNRLWRRLRLASLVLYVSVILASLYTGFSALATKGQDSTATQGVEDASGIPPESRHQAEPDA